jgi:hypothetical protein
LVISQIWPKRTLGICREFFSFETIMNYVLVIKLLSCSDFRATHRGTKERGEDTEVEQPGHQWHETDHCYDDAAGAVHEIAQYNQDDACHDTDDAASGGSHEFYEGVHFLSPI